MSTSPLRRRLAAAVLIAAANLGVMAAVATPALAQPSSDRVISVFGNNKLVLQPDRSAPGAAIRAVTRIGQAAATPDVQVWRQVPARQGGFNLVHREGVGGRQLCIDVQGDSTQSGAALVLRPCDGTDSQAWRNLQGSQVFTQLVNKGSELEMEVVSGQVVQADFPNRNDADARVRNNNRLFSIPPKSFGIGGA